MIETNSVLYGSVLDEHGDQYAPTVLTPTDDQRDKIVLGKPYIIPIVFIPGIMGTNLRKKGTGEVAWRPPNTDARGILDAIGQLFSYARKNAKTRQSELKTDEAEVDPSGPIDTAGTDFSKKVLTARGWGALLRSSYHPFLGKLQTLLNNLSVYDFDKCEANLQGWAKDDAPEAPTEWGSESGIPLVREEILHAANYQFDVWAAGYNWLQSNRDSGAAVKDYIEKVILPYYNEGKEVTVKAPDGEGKDKCSIKRTKPMRPLAEKVIVVTHSMGGLVSRALTEIHNCNDVMGVIHGVQPATGAPATYKRLRAGFEGTEKTILGRNAADVTAILSQAPGGLELLPTADYNDGKAWLKARDEGGSECSLDLPTKGGNPYDEIYLSPKWYGMIPEANEELMNPGGGESEQDPGDMDGRQSPRGTITHVIAQVRQFHEAIPKKYKKPTYAFYGAQGERDSSRDRGGLLGTGLMAKKARYTWGEVVWEGKGASAMEKDGATLAKDDGNGKIELSNGIRLKIAEPDTPGDGTVPCFSGEAPAKAGVAMSFAHGHGNPGKHNEAFCYDHQESYADKRALYASMYGIIKVAQQAQWHKR